MQYQSDLLLRLDRLERANRRWRWSSLASILGFLGILAVGFACPSSPVPVENQLVAERFVLTDAAGEERAVLDLDDQGHPQLLMRKEQAVAFLTLAGPALLLRGEDGKTSAFLGIEEASPRMELTSANNLDGLRATVQADGSAGFYALDASGRERATLESLAGGAAQMTARDGEGKVRGFFGLDASGAGSALLLDDLGRRRIGMVVSTEGIPALTTEDGYGRPRTELTMDRDGMPAFRLLREDGLPMFEEPK